jgi:hypothetical protein
MNEAFENQISFTGTLYGLDVTSYGWGSNGK